MTTNEMVTHLEAWKKLHAALETQYQAFSALTGAMPDCPLLDAVFRVWAAYTAAVGEIVGDSGSWMNWYIYECDAGKNPKDVILENGKKITVKTLRQLARVIKA